MKPGSKVGVALINWNALELTTPCIESLMSMTIVPSHIVVVDNASTDDSANRIEEAFPEVELIRNTANLGFTGGTNAGVARLLELGMDYIWILNNDTIVDGGCLELLLAALHENDAIAGISGGIFLFDRPDRIWYMGAWTERWTLRAPHRWYAEVWRGPDGVPIVVDFISGCCMLIRRSVLERVGLLDDHFFAYGEDYDWCLRARAAGQKLYCLPGAKLWHHNSASVNKNTIRKSRGTTSPTSHYLVTRNMLFILRKHASSRLQLVFGAAVHLVPRLLIAAAAALLGRLEKSRAIVRGMRDGLGLPL